MQFTGNTPVGSVAPPHDDARTNGHSDAGRGREAGLPHNIDDVPPGLLDALLHAPDVETDRLDRARAWLRRHADEHDEDDQAPSCHELAGCILDDLVAAASS